MSSTPLDPHPSRVASETETVLTFLDYFRSVMVRKVEGVDPQALRMSPVPSGTCLGGLIKHLAYVERWWFQAVWAGREVDFPWSEDDPDAEFRLEAGESADSLVALYRGECEISRQVVGADPDLDASVPGRHGEVSLRWIMVHMIEETARHAGHADLLREMADGATGD